MSFDIIRQISTYVCGNIFNVVRDMNVIESQIINAILATFPLLVYQYFVAYSYTMKMEKSRILLSVTLFISLFLTLNYKDNIPKNYELISMMIPLIIAYLNRKPKVGIIISIIVGEYLVNNLNYCATTIVLLFIFLYIFYKFYTITLKNTNYFINTSIILVSLAYTSFIIKNFSITILFNSIIAILCYLAIIKIIAYSIKKSRSIIDMHMTLKEFEKEKSIKINLFKITHEIKNPLAVIKGYLDMFDVKNKTKSERYIKIIKGEVNRTLNLLQDFMEFTKIKVHKSEFKIGVLFDDAKDVLIPFFNSKEVNYVFEREDDPIVNLDYNRMKQVIINVIKNAVEACPPYKGVVSTTIFVDKEYLYIFVKDNGSGMDEETLENILEPFYTTKEKGTGLGVSLSKEIIEAHGGYITYDSTLGKGTTCKIVLPLEN